MSPIDKFNRYLVSINPDFDPNKTPYDLTVFELVNKIEHFSYSVLHKKGFKRGSYIDYQVYFYINYTNEFGQIIKLGIDPKYPNLNLPFGIMFKIHKRKIIQKFRKEHFMKWLADIIANKAPKIPVYWKTNLTLYFIKYDIKH